MKLYVIQSKNGVMNNEYRCECKELNDWSSCKDDYMWNPGTCDCECNKVCKVDQYLHMKKCSWEKCIGKLVLACEDKILNTTETSLFDKKVKCEKIIALVTIFHWQLYVYYYQLSILLLVITIMLNTEWKESAHNHINIKWRVQKNLMLKIVRTTFPMTWSIINLDLNKIKIDEKP